MMDRRSDINAMIEIMYQMLSQIELAIKGDGWSG